MTGYEILEHTADVGLLATGDTLEEVFEQATIGLAEIIGIWSPGNGERTDIEIEGDDAGGLLVDWLSEVLWLHDSRDAVLAGVEVRAVAEAVTGSVTLAPRGDREIGGTQVKAITYHQLDVGRAGAGWYGRVFVDV